MATKTPRLLAAAKEFNIGKDTLKDFLIDKGFDVPSSPNFKLGEDMYDALMAEFAKDRLEKKKVDSISLPGTKAESENKSIEIKSKSDTSRSKDTGEVLKVTDVNAVNDEETKTPTKKTASTKKKATTKKKAATKKKTAAKKKADNEATEEKAVEESKTEAPKKETVAKKAEQEKADTPPEEEKTKESTGPKVVGTIDLDSIAKPKKKSADKKTANEQKPKKADSKKEEAQKAEEKKEEKPKAKEKTATDEVEKIPTKTVKLEGPKVLGKIEIKPKPDKKKRKRKRIIVEGENKPSRDNDKRGRGGNRGNSRNRTRKDEERVVDEKEVQDKIKETQARLAGTSKSKSAKAKYRKKKREDHAAKAAEEENQLDDKLLKVTEFITVSELASLMDISFTDVISKCMELGIMVSINQRLDAEVIELVASEFDYEVEFINVEGEEAEEEEIIDAPEDLKPRQPIVTIMGHVDHGKTSLLDYLRETNVASGEAGGITQHIGAYEVSVGENGEARKITFLDTPGHEAFTAMRARGVKVTDIAVIIIAADDDVMPQTKEAISHSQAAGVPMVFAINKIDKEGANPDKIKEQLSQMNILVEDWGGDVQSQEISAKSGQGVDDLLEKILLQADLQELKANPDRPAQGIILEASLDKGRGYVSSVLVENGTLNVGDMVVAGAHYGKVKALTNERGKRVDHAGPAIPVQVLGLNGAPTAGEKVKVYSDEVEAKNVANHRSQIEREQGIRTKKHITLDEIGRRLALGNFKELNVIIKADFDGSVEALADSLLKLSTDEVVVNVVHKGVGQITESDVLLATASDAVIIGFQVRPSAMASKIADDENIEIRYYSIIYDAINEIKSAMEGMLEPTVEKQIVAHVEIRETYKISGVGTIAGCYVTDGKISRSSKVNVIRDGIVTYTGELASLKRFKDDVKEVPAKMECGLSVKNYNDIKVGDILEAYEEVEIKRTL